MDKTWKVLLAFLGIFVAGLVVGGLGTLRALRHFRPPALGSPEQFGPQLLRRYAARLDLTPAQQEKIQPLVATAAEELRQLRRTTLLGSRAIIDRLQGEIAAQLTPEQKVRFDRLLVEQRERMKGFAGERGRRPRDSRPPAVLPPPPR